MTKNILYVHTHTTLKSRSGMSACLINAYLEITIHNISAVHMFKTEQDFCSIKPYFILCEGSSLSKVIM